MKCKVCGKNAQSEYCFLHKPKKQLTKRMDPTSKLGVGKSIQKRTSKQLSKEIDKKIQAHKMFEFFVDIWKKKKHVCENCNKYLGEQPLSYMFDHLLEKSKYPELKFEEENIMLVCLECHDEKTRGFYSEKVMKLIESLKLKYLVKDR
jgi:hypothetical protein